MSSSNWLLDCTEIEVESRLVSVVQEKFRRKHYDYNANMPDDLPETHELTWEKG